MWRTRPFWTECERSDTVVTAIAGPATLCVDAGTSLVKAVVFDDNGAEVLTRRRSTQILSPKPGRSEQDMNDVLASVFQTVAEAAAASPIPVGRLAITAQGDGAWMTDRHRGPAQAAVLWNDARALEVVQRWEADGVLDAAFLINGSLTNLGLPNAIMSWFFAHKPDVLDEVDQVLTCGSWLFGSLTDTWGLHPSDASAPWLDISTGTVSASLLDLYGLVEAHSKVPRVLQQDDLTQSLTTAAAEITGLKAGIPVTLAPYDVIATALGGGSTTAGSAFSILGTTLCTGTVLDAPDTVGHPTGLTLLSGAPEIFRVFPTLAGTGVLDWLASILGLKSAADVAAYAAKSSTGANDVQILPYLSPAGERAPFLDPHIRGTIEGLSFETTGPDLARAALEGLAHVIRDCLDASSTRPLELVVSGGGSASDVWCQSISDVTGTPVIRPVGRQAGARGAFLTAKVAAGDYPNVTVANTALTAGKSYFYPNDRYRDLHDWRHTAFLESRDARRAR